MKNIRDIITKFLDFLGITIQSIKKLKIEQVLLSLVLFVCSALLFIDSNSFFEKIILDKDADTVEVQTVFLIPKKKYSFKVSDINKIGVKEEVFQGKTAVITKYNTQLSLKNKNTLVPFSFGDYNKFEILCFNRELESFLNDTSRRYLALKRFSFLDLIVLVISFLLSYLAVINLKEFIFF